MGILVLLVVFVALAAPGVRSTEEPHLLRYAKSSSMQANTTNVVNGQSQPGTLLRLNYKKFSVRSIPLGTIKAGETIEALSEVEITNDLVTKDASGTNKFHDVAAAVTLVIAGSAKSTSGIEISEAQSNYVTPEVHHWTFEKSGTFTAKTTYSGRYLNLVLWAYMPNPPSQCRTFPRASAPSPQQPRDCGIDVYYGRGHLSALRFAPSASAPSGAQPFSVEDFSGPSVPEVSPSDAPITEKGDPAKYIAALSRSVGTLKQGDILTAHSELQADAREVLRSNQNCNVMVATGLYLSPSPNSLVGALAIGSEGGHNLSGRGGGGIKALKRGVVPSSATVKLDRDYTSPMHVVLRIWTSGNTDCAAYRNGTRVKLLQSQSFLRLMRYRSEQ